MSPRRVLRGSWWDLDRIVAFAFLTIVIVASCTQLIAFHQIRAQHARITTQQKTLADGVALLCNQSFIITSVIEQTVTLLQSEPQTSVRRETIEVFDGYLRALQDRAECNRIDRLFIGGH